MKKLKIEHDKYRINYHNIKSNVNIESLQYKPTLTRYMRDFYENSHMECRPIKD